MSLNKLLILSLLIIIPSKSLPSLKDLVTSLLIYEEGLNRDNICIPYINVLSYPAIGYGHICDSTKVATQIKAKKLCSSLSQICDKKLVKEWLSKQIDNSISCVKGNNIIKDVYNASSNYRKAIIISIAFQDIKCEFGTYRTFSNHLAKEDWSNAAASIFDFSWARKNQERAKKYSYVIKNDKCGPFCIDYGWN